MTKNVQKQPKTFKNVRNVEIAPKIFPAAAEPQDLCRRRRSPGRAAAAAAAVAVAKILFPGLDFFYIFWSWLWRWLRQPSSRSQNSVGLSKILGIRSLLLIALSGNQLILVMEKSSQVNSNQIEMK